MPVASISQNGNGQVVAADGGAKRRVVVRGYVLVGGGTGTATFTDGNGGTALTGALTIASGKTISAPVIDPTPAGFHEGWFATSNGNALYLNASTQVDGHLVYEYQN